MIYTATEMATKLSRITKEMHPDMLSMWATEIMEEIQAVMDNPKDPGTDLKTAIKIVQKQIDV